MAAGENKKLVKEKAVLGPSLSLLNVCPLSAQEKNFFLFTTFGLVFS